MINSDLVQRRLYKLGWTDRDFAKATGITYNRLMEIIWNRAYISTNKEVQRIADALGVPYETLVTKKVIPYNERFRNIPPLDLPALKKLMQEKCMTNKELAARCRITPTNLSGLFTGRVKMQANMFLKIAWALDVPPERIMQAKRPTGKSRKAKDSLPPK